MRGRRGRDRMVVGFTTTCTITTKILSSYPVHGEVYSVQHYVIKFVTDLRQVGGFLQYISEILLKVALNTINQPIFNSIKFVSFYDFYL